MNKMTVTKVRTGQENTNPAITTLVYREKSYPAREVQGKDGNYTVSVERLEQELLDGIKSLDPAAFELDRYTSERRYLNRFIRYVSIVSFISSYSFILLAFVDYLLNPRFGFFFYFLFHGCLLFFIGVYIGSKQT